MNTRERFLAVMNFEPVDRTLIWEMGYWAGAVRRWYEEGLPENAGVPASLPDGRAMHGEALFVALGDLPDSRDLDVHDYFGHDEAMQVIPLNNYLYPAFEEEVLEDRGDRELIRIAYGILSLERKDRASLPHWVDWPVKGREDWEEVKAERLQPTVKGRLPENWPRRVGEFRQRSYPLVIGGEIGFYMALRYLLGDERALTGFYDDPELMREIINYLADFWTALYDQVLEQIDADLGWISEDMCYSNGPFFSPAMFREFMLPAYKKLTGCWSDHGVSVVLMDSDGDCRELIPLLMEGGVTALMPLEVKAGMDVVRLRKAFPRLGLMGGIDKMKVTAGTAAVDEELERKVPFVLERGGYVPHVDHHVPPDVSWENFRYYREKLNTMMMQR